MSKQKKKKDSRAKTKVSPTEAILCATAVIQLLAALTELLEKLLR